MSMDFDVTITFSDASIDPAFGEALLEAFLEAAPACDPVVGQETSTQQTTVGFSVAAEDAAAASEATIAIVHAAASALRDTTARPTAIHVDAAGDRELQAA